jgi:polyferredoxin
MLVLFIVGSVMLYALATRSVIDLSVSHERNPLFVKLSSGDVRNAYGIRVLNKTHDDRTYSLSVSGIEGAQISLKGHGNELLEALSVSAGQVGRFDIFVTVPKASLPEQARTPIILTVEDQSTARNSGSVSYETMFIAHHR